MPILLHTDRVSHNFIRIEERIVWLLNVIDIEGCDEGDVNVILTGRAELLELNRKYLQHDTFTDILTFDYCEGRRISGDIYMSLDDIRENSNEFGSPVEEEIDRVMVHGILHLIGYKDKTKAEKEGMRTLENKYLSARKW